MDYPWKHCLLLVLVSSVRRHSNLNHPGSKFLLFQRQNTAAYRLPLGAMHVWDRRSIGYRRTDDLFTVVRRAACRMEYRGPDNFGYLLLDGDSNRVTHFHGETQVSTQVHGATSLARNVVLGHRRLSIIDLSENAAQPLLLADGRYSIIQNGEIYNYLALRAELEKLGHRFRAASDTEVLLAAYSEWGAGVLKKIEGMFAFAILDLNKQVLFLARDAFGIKPLYYAQKNGRLAFASEIAALLEFPWISRRANAGRVFEHLNYWTTDQTNGTFFADIRALPAAHYLEIRLDAEHTAAEPRRYWDIPQDQNRNIGLDEAALQLRELFLESVAQHLQTDVPWCVALSGGTDSSSIVMAARNVLGQSKPIHTVSYIANQANLNEEIWIDCINHASQATAHKLQIEDTDLGKDFVHLVKIQGQPMVTPVVYAQHRVFRHAGKCGFKVLLEGQGADELLAGYPFYLQARLASLLKNGEWSRALHFLWSAPPRFLANRRYVLRHALQRIFPNGAFARDANTTNPWISTPWAEQNGVVGSPAPSRAHLGAHTLRAMIYDTVTETKLPSLLRYGDHNAMAASVENRVPFLTKRLAEFLFSLPEEHIIADDGTTKNVLRHAMKGITPEFVLRRKNKIGFEPPYEKWMQGMLPLLHHAMENARSIVVFDGPGLDDITRQLKTHGVRSASFANRVWRIACFTEWVRQYGVKFA